MSSLAEIQAAVEALPLAQQQKLFQQLKVRLWAEKDAPQKLPCVATTGQPITQEEIDDARDAD